MSDFKIGRLVIVGVGLIGGSLARALRRGNTVDQITGVGRNEANLQRAVELGVINDYFTDAARACENADIIVLASPVGAMQPLLLQILPVLKDNTIITDVGSVKGEVVAAAEKTLGKRFNQFVPAHPIAGTEESGVEASFESLFDDRRVIVTPVAQTDGTALQQVVSMWSATGAHVNEMSVQDHDRVLATTSHMPHVLAYALVSYLASRPQTQTHMDFAAGGFYDFTRIASSDAVMWRDICFANKDEISARLKEFSQVLDQAIASIDSDNESDLQAMFENANNVRRQLGDMREHPNKAPSR